MVKVKPHELRKKDVEGLQKQLDELRTELQQLRVVQVSGGAPAKLAKIRVVRKGIARLLTVICEKQRAEVKEKYANKKRKPVDLREKKTRAIRRALTKEERENAPLTLKKKAWNFPQRNFSVAN